MLGADLTVCFGQEMPALMAGDLNAKHMDWISRLSTRRRKLLRYHADEKSHLIFGPDSPTSNPYNPYIMITKNLNPGVCDFVLCTKIGPPPATH
jgi:hypothetical protein